MTRRSMLLGVASGLALLTGPAAAAPPPAAEEAVVVLAASSLTESLQKLATTWTARGHPAVTFSFDSSSRLARQVEAGAPADVFFSADRAWMDHVEGQGLIDSATRVDLLGNSLVAVLPAGATVALASVADLGKPQFRRIGLAGENVPAGRYARAALENLGAWDAVKDRVVNGDNVRSVLGWVASGEADAGIVYATDARVEPRVKVALTFPATSHPAIVYPAAVLTRAAHTKEAVDFLAYCQSADGMAVFLAAGFTVAPPAAAAPTAK